MNFTSEINMNTKDRQRART